MLGIEPAALDDDACVRTWAGSGAMYLTGPASGPPCVSPAGIVRPLLGLGDALAAATRRLGTEVKVDAVGLAARRAAFAGFGRNGSGSAGGFAQMVRARDGWVVLNLPRPSDTEALPALVGAATPAGDWGEIERRIAAMTAADAVQQGSELGLAVAAVGATPAPRRPWSVRREVPARPLRRRAPVVIDLTSLWAGPLAGGLLAEAGCRVLKVESSSRPDGARRGPAGFFQLLNHRKEQLSLDLPTPGAIGRLRELIAGADLVLEASRPRVMQQWGISPEDCVTAGTVWVSITGHGRSGQHGNRVAFGDDAAASGGLVVAGDPPMFVGDAIADPIAGLAAASIAAHLLADARPALVDVSLASAAAWVAAHGGAAIERPVVRDGDGWQVRLVEGPVIVRPPTAPTMDNT
ncbi:MAG: CoA transferase [Acidimicrobiia bacterium]|nr:CoA transferase [Acidimicrobiia bacterium]